MSGKYKMGVSLQVVNHLGLNLYSNTPAVISEAVANAWDADAQNVSITIEKDSITISDDGIGMTCSDINNKYLNVGYMRRNDAPVTPIFSRRVMGRKGIGKLSLFSIAKIITVFSKKDNDENALVINTDNLIEAIAKNEVYFPEEINFTATEIGKSGTKIVLTELKKQRTALLETHLRPRLARRFSVIGEKFHFFVSINGTTLTTEDRNLLPKAQCLWIYPDIQSEDDKKQFISDIMSQTKNETLEYKENRDPRIQIGDKTVSVTGWLATATEPSALDDSDNLNCIVIMVRGKTAKEDVLSEIKATAIYTKYLFGELRADFLDDDNESDISTSSRQDFLEDDPRYTSLIQFIQAELSNVRSKWEDHRSGKGTEEACRFEVVKNWYDGLQGDEKTAAKKLFGKINQLTVDAEQKKSLFQNGVLAFESYRLKKELSVLETISADNLEPFFLAASRLNDIEATMYYQIITERLAVIKKMRDVVSDGSLEKVVQHHLGKNLWLLDPSWDRGTELPTIEESFKKQFFEASGMLTQEELDARLDIKYKKTTGKHVIIELKKGDRTLSTGELTQQITKYSDAMDKIIEQSGSKDPYEIIILLGKRLGGPGKSETAISKFIASIEPYHARVLYYTELLTNAEIVYQDYLQKNKEFSAISNMISQIDV